MNRSALCIKMLHILYGSSQPISKSNLATLLETNIRNISEFKKELEIAGYLIEIVAGKYGGYRLREESVFPSLSLDSKEKESIGEALTYLNAQKNFIYYSKFSSAMNKLKARTKDYSERNDTIYFVNSKKGLSKSEDEMVALITKARDLRNTITFQYLSNNNDGWDQRLAHPYEMIVTEEGFYMLAYDLSKTKNHDFKFFKIIDERMSEMKIENSCFQRDINFKINDYMGKNTLMKQLNKVELEITGIHARLVNEREIENIIEKKYENNILHITFMMAGTLRLKNFILSLGSDCKVIAPIAIRKEIYNELQATIRLYK